LELNIFARNIDVDEPSREYINKKFRRLQRHLRNVSEAKLEVSRTSARTQDERVIAQLTLTTGGRVLRGQERGLNLFAAVDAVTDVLDRQIDRYKGKVYRSKQPRKAGRELTLDGLEGLDSGALSDTEGSGFDRPRVVRTKQFVMKPMTVEEAITEMELLSHSFFLFFNADSSGYNVVYRRQDGEYGVIEPALT
jgi:putative sigma-54 modulation protein